MPEANQDTAIFRRWWYISIFLLGTKLWVRVATSPERAENIQPSSPAKKHSATAFFLWLQVKCFHLAVKAEAALSQNIIDAFPCSYIVL